MEKLFYKNLDLNDIVYFDETVEQHLTEQWKDIPNYEGLYKASDLGRIKSLERYKKNWSKLQLVKERILKQCNCTYLSLELNKESVPNTVDVHVVVGITFLGHVPCRGRKVVDHKNNNKKDNRLCNLQIITRRKNSSKDKNPASGHTRISKVKDKYSVSISVNCKTIYLGLFPTLKEAKNIYRKAIVLSDKGKSVEHLKVRQIINTTTNIIGVYKYRTKFVACIFIKSRKKQIGTYDTLEQAVIARKDYLDNALIN